MRDMTAVLRLGFEYFGLAAGTVLQLSYMITSGQSRVIITVNYNTFS